MTTLLSHTLLNAVRRLAGTAREIPRQPPPHPDSRRTPDHIMRRLEDVFDALGELSSQPHVAAALELVCDTLQAELPSESVVAGVYDIDSDEIRFMAAQGVDDLLRGTSLPRGRCLVGYAGEDAVIARGGAGGVEWLGTEGANSTILLCPILHDAHLLGVIALADPLCSARYTQNDVELVRYVAAQVATFIQARRHRAPHG